MNRKSLAFSVLVIALAALSATAVYQKKQIGEWKDFQRDLSSKTQTIENLIDKIEKGFDSNIKISDIASKSLDNSLNSIKSKEKIDASLMFIIDKLSRLENFIANKKSTNFQPRALVNPPPQMDPRNDPTLWIKNLSEDKKRIVEEIFKENIAFIKKNLPEGSPPDRENLKKIMEESQRILKDKMKAVLDEDEYQAFLDSIARPVIPAPNIHLKPSP